MVKHARAGQVSVDLRYADSGDRGAELRVRDDGRGFDPREVPPDHLGLSIMRERADAIGATLAIQTEVGAGTEVVVTWSSGEPVA